MMLADLGDEVVNIKLVPDLLHVTSLRSSVENVDGLPFIAQFRSEIPGYKLCHKAKAGMTGWAQVHGWRSIRRKASIARVVEPGAWIRVKRSASG